jgi:hypothetical protein
MRRLVLAAVLASAVLLLGPPAAGAQSAPPPCATGDLGCQLTAGLTNLATSLGVTPTTIPAQGTTTTAPASLSAALGGKAVAASSSAATPAASADAMLSSAVVPAVPVGVELVLPPLAAPDFGPARAPVPASAVVARAARVSRPPLARPARPGPAPVTSAPALTLVGCLGLAALLFAAAFGARRLPTRRRVSSTP